MDDAGRVARVGDLGCKLVGQPEAAFGSESSMTPPSKVMRPPSKAAVSFLRPISRFLV